MWIHDFFKQIQGFLLYVQARGQMSLLTLAALRTWCLPAIILWESLPFLLRLDLELQHQRLSLLEIHLVTTSYGKQVHFSRAIKVEGLSVILLSMHRLFEEGYVPSLTKDGGCLMRGSQKLGEIKIHDGIYYLCLGDSNNISNCAEQFRHFQTQMSWQTLQM
jgi:hypothetical protein